MTAIEKVHELAAAGFNVAEIRQNMRQQGYTHHEISAAMEQYYEHKAETFKTKNPLLTARFTPLVLAILLYLVFFHFIPVGFAHAHYILLATFGGIIAIILSFWLFANFAPKLVERVPIFTGITSILMLFVFGAAFISRTSGYGSREIAEHGVSTTAQVVGRSYVQGRRGNRMYSMDVQFYVGKQLTGAELDVTEREFGMFPEGASIPIIYSSEHPTIVRVGKIDYRDNFRRYR